MKKIIYILSVSFITFSCTKNANDTGLEFADNMYVSHPLDPLSKPADKQFPYNPENKSLAMISPVNGTIARGKMPYNIHKDSLELAAKVLKNPIQINDLVIEDGKALYGRFCSHCHGETGNADGPVADPKKFAGVAKLNSGRVATVSEGHIFHVITHGKGRMGSHASQLNQEERWKIVHYVMSLRK